MTPFIKPGITTGEIDRLVEEYMRENGAIPATLGYKGYPKSSCISLNEVVCHGIPGDRILQDGDILNVDVTAILDGYYGDTSTMFMVGEVSDTAKKLMDVTKRCLEIGIEQVKPGNFFGNIGYHIYRYASSQGFSVVHQFCGHGVGLEFHEEPQVSHVSPRDTGAIMKPGMIFTIEPMINEGSPRTIIDATDKWTARTEDNKLSAQYEHTVLVTDDGVEILTREN